MRVWKQPWPVWLLGLAVATTAAVTRAQETTPGTPQEVRDVTVDNPGVGIAPAQELGSLGRGDEERALAPAEVETQAASNELFANETRTLWRCRHKVAFAQKVAPAAIPPGRVLVRFVVDTSGQPRQTAVVALEPLDTDVLFCVKDEVQSWRLEPPPVKPVTFTREVDLRAPNEDP